jgi:general stress protein 26
VTLHVEWHTVENQIRKHNYGILSTITKEGMPHSTGIMYAVSVKEDIPFSLYFVVDKKTKKARNIEANPNVAFVIPVPHRFLGFVLPPNLIQFKGTATIVTLDEKIKSAFSKSIALREVLKSSSPSDTDFIKMVPSSPIHTYGIGLSSLSLIRNFEGASSKVEIAQDQKLS